jgi:hypothetical protein
MTMTVVTNCLITAGMVRLATTMVATALLLATGCGSDGPMPADSAGGSTSLPLSAELRRHRADEGRRIIQVTMTNTGPDPLVVHELTLDAPGFAGLPPTPKGSTVRPGIPVDLPIPYGTTDCAYPTQAAADTQEAERTTHVRLLVGRVNGPARDIRLEVDPAPLDRLRAAECAQAALARAVTVSFDTSWIRGTRDGLPALDGTLVLRRGAAAGPVAVTALDGSTLLDMHTAAVAPRLPVVMPTGVDRIELAVQVTAKSCDPHVRSQSQRPYELSVYVSVDGAEPLFVAPDVDAPARAGMREVIASTCAEG